MSSRTPARASGVMIALAVITLVLSSYDLYRLATDHGDMPPLLALLAVAGADLFAVAAGRQAMTVAEDGDSSAPWNVLVVLFAALSAALQFSRAVLDDMPLIVGVMFAMFPLATVVLFEGALRRAHRLNGRPEGRVAPPRATFEPLQWIFYRKATMYAFRYSIADRSLGADGAFKLGLLKAEQDNEPTPPPPRRRIDLEYTELLGTPPALSGTRPVMPALPAGSGPESPDMRVSDPAPVDEMHAARTVTDAVRTALSAGDPDNWPGILAAVRTELPDANPETVRRTYRRLRKEAV